MKTAIAIVILALIGGAAIVVAGGAAMAQGLQPEGSVVAGRYQMQPVEGGVARLDTVTGEMSFCRIDAGKMSCEPSAEDRQRLEARLRELAKPAPPAAPEARGGGLPSAPLPPAAADADLDRAIDQMKKVFRAFRDITREFDDAPGDTGIAPNRT